MANHNQLEHPLRRNILAEIHARPFRATKTPRSFLKQTFVCKPSSKYDKDLTALSAWCDGQSIPLPEPNTRHHSGMIDDVRMTWERHSEFITVTWACAFNKKAHDKLMDLAVSHSEKMMAGPPLLISSTRLELAPDNEVGSFAMSDFSKDSICISDVERGQARITTDFHQDEHGSTRFLVQNIGLGEPLAGVLTRRILEMESYRIMALLGFEEVKKISPKIAEIERQLVKLTSGIRGKSGLQETRDTLEQITDIAAELADLSAASQYRLSATRAYFELVNERLGRIDEIPLHGYNGVGEFLNKRLIPAMRTCQNTEKRIGIADEKLSRSTDLLRTKVDIQMQAQNHTLLDTMNKRALMQYRLQSTVEGLSIAAVSYYVVGLIAYFTKGIGISAFMPTKLLTAISVPIVVLAVWYIIRRVRKHHEK